MSYAIGAFSTLDIGDIQHQKEILSLHGVNFADSQTTMI